MKKWLAMLLTAVMCMSMFTGFAAAEVLTYADTIAWDGEYDVIVAGFGGAGGTAASHAADAGAKVLIVEKAPEGAEGGNTRLCGQLFAYGNENEEATFEYYKAIAGTKVVPDEVLRVYTNQIAHIEDYVAEMFSLDKNDFISYESDHWLLGAFCPEYPEVEAGKTISLKTLHEGFSDAYMWKQIRRRVFERKDSIDVWYESPAVGLIQDPITKTILGVKVQREGKILNMRAKNGVVLATGGFENNPEMVETYLGFAQSSFGGSEYNTGDGIIMAMDVGAKLWHMDVWEGAGYNSWAPITDVGNCSVSANSAVRKFASGSAFAVAMDGSRYVREDEASRHGHVYTNGYWEMPHHSLRNFMVYDQAQADQVGDLGSYAADVIKADTFEELAEKTGMNAEILRDTVAEFNGYAETGVDLDFGRAAENMRALSAEGPYYAMELIPAILNTQGGPVKNENAEVIGMDGNPIPHLYVAGEMGGICSLQYQGGSNIAECLIFGKIAGENAAKVKEEVKAELIKVESPMTYMPGNMTDVKDDLLVETNDNELVGTSENGMGGKLVVKVTYYGNMITAVEVVEHNETAGISDPAIEQIPAAICSKNTTEVDTITGATITSKAIIEAVNNALAQVK